jgi:hypothetical protein
MKRRTIAALATVSWLIALFLLAGCGSTPSSSQAVQRQSPSTDEQAAAPVANQRRKPAPWYRRGMRTVGFQSPTGNIRCALDANDNTQLLCKTLNNENAVVLDTITEPDMNYTATIPAEPTLGYDRGWSSANFYCWSKFTGVTCQSLYSTSGFEINRDGITSLVWDHAILEGESVGSGSDGATSNGLGADSGSGSGSDTGGDFCTTHTCIGDWNNPGGSIVQCNDGTWSHSGGESGACSWHGGER